MREGVYTYINSISEGKIEVALKRKKLKYLVFIIVVVCLGAFAYLGSGLFHGAVTIHQLLTENKHLKQAITNLTEEEQIGYAKIVAQEMKDGRLFTTVKFVETARDDKLKKIMEKEYTIEGDIVHFDALIVKFGDKMVMDGKTRALYLWRRVYGEKMAPEKGFVIEQPGTEPLRYGDLLEALPIQQRQMFWSSIWELANDKEKLKQYDIEAIYGNVVYSKLREGLIYVFKLSPTGHFYDVVIPDM